MKVDSWRLRASNFCRVKINCNRNFVIITPPLLALPYFGTFWASLLNFKNCFVWFKIHYEGSVPEMRLWSILLIKYDYNVIYILVEDSFYIINSILNV